MKKEFDFDDDLEELEEEVINAHSERAKIMVTVIPFVLIIIILVISLIVSGIKNSKLKEDNQDLQESIKEYADEQMANEYSNFEETIVSVTATPVASPAATTAVATKTPYQEIMKSGGKDYSKIAFHKEEQLKEMMTYWEDNNQKALDDLANLDHYKAMSFSLRGTKEFYYYGETDGNGKPNGTGIAAYSDNQYYYGEWQNGLRSGNGTWIHYHIHETPSKTDLYTYHQYTGAWKDDLPDGEGSEHYDFNMDLLKENTGYNSNLIGSYSEGMVNGEFYLTNIYSDGEMLEWYATAEHGSWIYQNENVDPNGRRPVQVEDRDPDNYIWLHPDDNHDIGVPCLISSQKN